MTHSSELPDPYPVAVPTGPGRQTTPAEAHLANVLAHTAGVIVTVDRAGTVTAWSPGAVELFGHPTERAVGVSLASLDAGAPGRLHEVVARVLRTGSAERAAIPCRRAAGPPLEADVVVAPARGREGEIAGATIVAHEASDHSGVEPALNQAHEQLNEFLTIMSHELRTPLTAVIGYTDLLTRGLAGPLPPRAGSYLDHVRTAGRHLLELVNGLLEYARLEASSERLNLRGVELRQAVEQAVERVHPQTVAKKLKIGACVEPSVGRVVADEDKLQQMLGNFLTNAVKFTPVGGDIQVEARPAPEDGKVLVTVRDSGIGLADDQIEQVWKRFYQADTSLTREHSGLGLGLAIVRHLAEAQGGRAWAESHGIGKGSTFAFTLPLARE